MILPPSVAQSIDKNEIEIGQGWLYSSLPIWAPTYAQELDQPVSVSAVGLSDLRFLGEKTTIVIRQNPDDQSLVLWSGIAKLIEDPAGGGGPSELPLHGELPGRAASDSHPISAITDLAVELAGKAALLHAPTHRVGGTDPLELTAADVEFAQVKHGFETVQTTGAMPFTASYDNGTRVLTLTPTGASFSWWWYGVEHVQVGAFSLPAHSSTTGLYFASFDSAGAVTISTTPWEILNAVPIAIFDQNSVRGQAWVYPEWHTIEMDPLTHKYHHLTSGTRFVDGGAALSGYTYNVDSLAAVTFGVASAEIWDEDLRFQIPALADGGPYQIRYQTAPGSWIWDAAATVPYKVGATYITADIAGVQTQADGTGLGQCVNSYVLLIPGLNGPQTIILQGQGIFTTQADAQAESWNSLSKTGLPFQEFYAVWRVTYWARSTHTGVTGRVRMVSITPVNVSASGSVGGSSVHNALSGRSDADCHPTAAITGLDAALAGKAPAFVSGAQRLFWATPNGASGIPSLRAIVASDLPALSYLPLAGGTLSGQLILTKNGYPTAAAAIRLESAQPTIAYQATGSAVNSKIWYVTTANTNSLDIISADDAQSAFLNGISFYRAPASNLLVITVGHTGGSIYLKPLGAGVVKSAANGLLSVLSGTGLVLGDGTTIPQSTFATGGPFLPLAGGTMANDAQVVFNNAAADFGPSAITINRPHYAGSQAEDAGIDVSAGSGHGLRIALLSGNFYSGLQVVNASAEFAVELLLSGAGAKSLYAAGSVLIDGAVDAGAGVNVSGGAIQIAGDDAITSARAGDLTALKVASTTGFVRSASGDYSASPLVSSDLPIFYENHADGTMSPTGSGGTNALVQASTEAIGSLTTDVAPAFTAGRAIEFEFAGTGVSNASAGNHNTGFRIASTALGLSPTTDTIAVAFPSGSMAYKWSAKARVFGRYLDKTGAPTLFTPVIFIEYAVTMNGLSYSATATATGGTVDAASAINATWTVEAIEGSALLPASMHCIYSRIK